MSRSLMLKMSGLMLFGATAGAVGMGFYSNDPAINRGTASVAMDSLRPPLVMGKHLSVVQVSLQAPSGIPDREDQEATLVGWIRLNQAVDKDLNFKWDLPPGVHVVSGSVEDTMANMKVGQTAQVNLTVTGFSKEDLKLVSLAAFVQAGETKLGNSAVLTSRPEDSYEMLAMAAGVDAAPKKRPLLKGKLIR